MLRWDYGERVRTTPTGEHVVDCDECDQETPLDQVEAWPEHHGAEFIGCVPLCARCWRSLTGDWPLWMRKAGLTSPPATPSKAAEGSSRADPVERPRRSRKRPLAVTQKAGRAG